MIELAGKGPSRGVWSVASLVQELAQTLLARFSMCAVRGEISGFSRAASGHCYFNLKDADGGNALVRCAMFRRAASLLDFAPADGQLIELRGRLAVYEPRGELQLVVEGMQRAGAGALYEQYLRLKTLLEAQGLFDAGRKRSLPPFPRCVGVVTSLGGAVLHDVATALARRAPHVRLIVYPSLVQGPDAPRALCEAIELASRRAEVDVLMVCRGGGSLEDLWAFSDERVVRAIAAASMPVVSGVGHETDVSLSDFVADLRAPTPTAAAELVTPTTRDCLEQLGSGAARMARAVQQAFNYHAQRLDRAALQLARPAQALRDQNQRLGLLAQRLRSSAGHANTMRITRVAQAQLELKRAAEALLGQRRQQLDGLALRLRSVDPQRVLARGYAWLADPSGRAVTTVRQVAVGAELRAVLADGAATVQVTEVSGPDKGRRG
ncbi:MAG: exodeoxyribonuclease VII large subunit [Burkholderiales bacterium]